MAEWYWWARLVLIHANIYSVSQKIKPSEVSQIVSKRLKIFQQNFTLPLLVYIYVKLGALKMQDLKMQELQMKGQMSRPENAGPSKNAVGLCS